MRSLFLALAVWACAGVASAAAQPAQTSVDLIASSVVYSSGVVRATIDRKDPAGQTPAALVRARVTIAVKPLAPFYTTEVLIRRGSFAVVSAPYAGFGPNVVFVATVTPIGLKELAPPSNRRESMAYNIAANRSPNERPVKPSPNQPTPNRPNPNQPNPNQPNPNQPNPNQPNPNQPSPAPPPPAPPAPPPPPPTPDRIAPPGAISISATGLVLIGGAQGTPAASPTGASIAAPALTLIGGAQRTPAARASGTINIVTPPLVLIGRE